MKKISLLIILSFVFSFQSNAKDVSFSREISPSCNFDKDLTKDALNLSDVIELAMCNNPSTKQAWLLAKASEANYKKTWSGYLPDLSLSADYQKTDGEDYANTSSNLLSSEDGSLGLSLNWLLYDFGKRESSVERTFQTMNSSKFQYNNTLQQVAYDAIVAYYDALSSIEELAALRANEEASLKSFELALRKFELGISSKADTLQTETTYAQRQLETTRQEQVVRVANANLARLLGLAPSNTIKLVPSIANTTDELIDKSVDELISIAMVKRPDLQSQNANLKSSYANVRSASAAYFPTISGFGSKSWNDNDIDINSVDLDKDNYAIGVKISMPIFTGFENTYSLRNAKYQYAADKEALTQLEQNIEVEVVNTYNDYKTSVKSLSIARKLFESAKENEKVALGSYEAGKGDIISLMEAQSKLLDARKELISANYGLYTAKIALLKVAGELNLNNLGDLK